MPRPIPSALRVAAVGLLGLGLPALYVARIGPAARMADDEWLTPEAFRTYYAPFCWLTKNAPVIDRALA